MTDAAAISGDFATYRHVQGRKVLQLVIEVPAEMASAVFAALGTPGAGEGIPVALARLQTVPEQPSGNSGQLPAPKERRPFSELPYSQQAAMRCAEPEFFKFLQTKFRPDAVIPFDPLRDNNAPPAVPYLRNLIGIGSRRDLDHHPIAAERWQALEAEYYAWSRGMR